MNTLQTPSKFFIPQLASISVDFIIVCLWSTVGLVLAALMFTLGFAAEAGQALVMAG
jgi:hypothetical protein